MFLSKSPMVEILAFITVLFVMPLGHTLMILIEKVFGNQYQFLGAFGVGLLGAALLYISVKQNKETPSTGMDFLQVFFFGLDGLSSHLFFMQNS